MLDGRHNIWVCRVGRVNGGRLNLRGVRFREPPTDAANEGQRQGSTGVRIATRRRPRGWKGAFPRKPFPMSAQPRVEAVVDQAPPTAALLRRQSVPRRTPIRSHSSPYHSRSHMRFSAGVSVRVAAKCHRTARGAANSSAPEVRSTAFGVSNPRTRGNTEPAMPSSIRTPVMVVIRRGTVGGCGKVEFT